MKQQGTKKFGFLRSLLEKYRSGEEAEDDLLLRAAVDNAVSRISSAAQQNDVPNQSATYETSLARAHNGFGFRLFHVLTEGTKQNVFLSPTSIALALGMIYNGASGETQTEMAQILQLQEISEEGLNRYSAALIDLLDDVDSEVELFVANSLWMKYANRVLPQFKETAQKRFHAELGSLAGAPDTINHWINQKTQGKIGAMVGEEVHREDVHAVLVNAIYFRGRWTEHFDPGDTRDQMFTLLNDEKIHCKMMKQDGAYHYLQERHFQAIRLPYGEQNISLFVFLPNKNVAYFDFLSSFTPENWRKWRGEFQSKEGFIGLPRFRCEYAKDLGQTLSAMGMSLAFDREHADFSRLSPEFYLALVRHKTFVEVKEEGTEAAAVTMAEAQYGAWGNPEPEDRFTMIVERPFFCAIVDERTETILFMGAILEP